MSEWAMERDPVGSGLQRGIDVYDNWGKANCA